MENQTALFKGELMEELVRNYFISSGYFVVRGIKFKFDEFDVTDIDLFLYGKSSGLSRLRINVDIKNKKSPQAFERIVWANGLMKILNFDSCIVATTDTRPVIHSFAQRYKTIVLDGAFLQKLRVKTDFDRLTEEDLMSKLSEFKSYKTYNRDWRYIYELSKSKLLTELDYSGFNSIVGNLIYFSDKYLSDHQKKEIALRMYYLTLSHLLIIMDFILKDISFLEQQDRERKLSEGLRFGNLGRDGVDKIISMAIKISGEKSTVSIKKSLESIPTDILKNFFTKFENTKNIFTWAREFEYLGYRKEIVYPDKLDVSLKAFSAVMLDYTGIDRKKFFESQS